MQQDLVVNPELTPEELAREEMRKALYKRAMGYEVEEVYRSSSPAGPVVTIRKKHIPGDPRAMVEYIRLFGTDTGGWS